MPHNYFWITIFGILGVLARYQVGVTFDHYNTSFFPWATLTVNLIGAFLIGLMYIVLINGRLMPSYIALAIVVGFLGGFTTFSAMTLDVYKLINATQYRTAWTYIIVSLAGGISLTFVGAFIGKFLFPSTN